MNILKEDHAVFPRVFRVALLRCTVSFLLHSEALKNLETLPKLHKQKARPMCPQS